jgi:hypothetical protein
MPCDLGPRRGFATTAAFTGSSAYTGGPFRSAQGPCQAVHAVNPNGLPAQMSLPP